MTRSGNIFVTSVIVLSFLFTVTSCGDKGRIIPDDTLALICADMFIADQWVLDNRLLQQADTMLLYEPVFNKYGYTYRDFQFTLDKQMYNPSKFARVITQSQVLLQERIEELNKQMNVARKDTRTRYDSGFRTSFVGCVIDSTETSFRAKCIELTQE